MDAVHKQIAEEAADWLVRLDEDPNGSAHADFVAWLKRSPRHIDEFLMVEASYRAVEQFHPQEQATLDKLLAEASAEIVPLNSAQPATTARRTAVGPKWWLAVAATAVFGGVLLVAVSLSSTEYATATGEQRAFKLPDGSLLNLNTQSWVEIDFSETAREVRLVAGEALFTVKQDATRPFRVSTETAVVQAIGTAFNVYRRADDSTFVSVLEGRVKVTAQNAVLPLAAGEEANVSKTKGAIRRKPPDVDQSVAWRQRRLVFRNSQLAEVVAEFNRYNADVQLRVAGQEIAHRRITGTFDADEPQAFVKFLAEDASIRLEKHDKTIAIGARPSAE